MYGIHRTYTKTAAVSYGTSHITTKQHYNHFSGYSKHAVSGYNASLAAKNRFLVATMKHLGLILRQVLNKCSNQ